MKRIASRCFTLMGFLCLFYGGFLIWRRYDPHWLTVVRATQKTAQAPRESSALPVRMRISAASIDLPVTPSKIVKGEWETSLSGISYLASSARPGTMGNSIFYGHNWPTLLGRLTRVQPGDDITVTDAEGRDIRFTVTYIQTVSADRTDILRSSRDRRITLYTCTGILDSKRLVITAIAR